MQVKGQARLPAPRRRVWTTLLDPDALQRCLPGCQQFEQVAPDEWQATMSVGIAAIRGTYSGRVRISDQQPETSYRLAVEGSGAGSRIRGDGVVTLAAVGQRLLPPAAKMLADQFFRQMGAQVEERSLKSEV